jgi:SAM-dependent methyltransferase
MIPFDAKEYWETRLGQEFNLHGVGFLGCGRDYNNWLYKVRRTVFLRLIRRCRLDLASAKVLDIGTGTGFYLDRWRELGARNLTGVDITETAVGGLREKYPDCAFYRVDIGGDLGEIRDLRFDAISCLDVLMHIVDDGRHQRAIENIHSLLNPGGIFVFSDSFVHGEPRRDQHIVHRPLDTVEALLHQVGFEPIERRPMFVLMNAPVDSDNRLLNRFWFLLHKGLSRVRIAGKLVGGALYPIELALVRLLRESPTTEIMVCKRSAGVG